MSAVGSPQGGSTRRSWQDQLQDYCRFAKLAPPSFNIVSDRRGGRTAWSSTVTIGERVFDARYWYDGQYINNGKEDAAEVALKCLNPSPNQTATTYPGQLYQQAPPPINRR